MLVSREPKSTPSVAVVARMKLVAPLAVTKGVTSKSTKLLTAIAPLSSAAAVVRWVRLFQVSEVSETVAIEHERVETADPNAFEGDETVTTPGVAGEKVTVYRVTVVDGVETSREELSSQVTREPVAEQVAVGSKARPTNSPSADGLNWAALAKCESGGRPNAVSASGTYRGMYQFSTATWSSVGGSGDPAAASADEQTYRAQLLYQRSGAGQWPHCGSRLFS